MSVQPFHPVPSRRRQRGAAAVSAAILMLALIALLALGVDVGRLYYGQRDLQRLANIAALDATRVLSGCASGTGVPGTEAQVAAEMQASLLRNAGSLEGLTSSVEIGRETMGGASDNGTGLLNFQTLPGGDPKLNAVRVQLSRAAPRRLLPGVTGNTSTLSAYSVASQRALAGFDVGSGTLGLSTRESALLNPVVESLLCPSGSVACTGAINLNAADFNGLAAAQLSLGNLVAGASGVGLDVDSVAELMALELTLPEWLGVLGEALETAVDATGGAVSSDVADLVRGLAGAAEPGTRYSLGSLLALTGSALSGPTDAALAAVPFVDARSLVMALGQAAHVGSPLEVRGLGLDVPGVATVKAYLQVIQPPKKALGAAGTEAATASTQQVELKVRVNAGSVLSGLKSGIESLINGLLSLGSLVGVGTTVTVLPTDLALGVDVTVAGATARLDQLLCPARATGNDGMPVARLSTTTNGAQIRVGTFSSSSTAPASLTATGTLPLATIAIDASCVGVKLGNTCLGVNLGTSQTQLNLGFTSVDVANGPRTTLADVTDYTLKPDSSPPEYLAANPSAGRNPQSVGSPVNASVNLGLSSVNAGGTGLTGALTGLVSSVVNGVNNTLLAPLLNIVNGLGASTIDPLLANLGLRLGTATVTVHAVTVDQPALVTTSFPEFSDTE